MKTRPYVIVAPTWGHRADVRVLHTLCHELNSLGLDASLLLTAGQSGDSDTLLNPALHTPVINPLMERHWGAINEEAIVVYAGSVPGNPFNARRVIRYVMNRQAPGAEAGAPGEYRVYLSKSFPVQRQASQRVLFLLPVDLGLFHAKGAQARTQDMLWLGAGVGLNGEAPPHLVPITESWPPTREELATQLRRTRHLHSYDAGALLNLEAALCGAVVILHRLEGSAADLRADFEAHESGTGGIAFGDSPFEIERAVRTRQELVENLRYQQASFRQRLLDFVHETQLHFK
ncbi:MAG: hypothetical protein JO006_08020 [Paucibacter sp.]|nr:hypothetical protein [Roseateles sp.]